jgi:lipoprotein-releasing system permease protein
MSFGPAFFIGRRMLAGRRLPADELPGRRYIRGAVAGVALSLVPLVVVLVVADGMIQGITARYIETSTYHIQAHPFQRETSASLFERAASLAREPTIIGAFPEMQGPAMALAGSKSAGAAIRAIDPVFLADPGVGRYLKAVRGELALSSANDVLLGEALARNLGVEVGQSISLVTARLTGSDGSGFSPKVSVFRVRGIVTAGYRDLDALWAFVSLKAGGRILSPETSISLIGVKVSTPFGDLSTAMVALSKALPPDWSTIAWPDAEKNIWESFATTRALLLLIMVLVVAVAAINVGSALVMLVLERRKDIAILKSQGASSPFLGFVFVFAGLVIGGMGTLIGLSIGSVVAWRVNDIIAVAEILVNLFTRIGARLSGSPVSAGIRLLDPAYYLEHIPIRLDFSELAFVAGLSLALCLVASLLAARRASRLPPLEILRKI